MMGAGQTPARPDSDPAPPAAMIDFQIPEETRLLVDTVRRFVETEVQPLEEEMEARGVPGAGKVGGAPVQGRRARPLRHEHAGGGGRRRTEHRRDVPGGGAARQDLGGPDPKHLRSGIRNAAGLRGPPAGGLSAALGPRGIGSAPLGITEPEAGSDAANIRTTAVRDGEDYVLDGSKHFISDGDIADFAVVMALTDPEKRARGGITLFLVDRDTPGYRVGRVQPMMGHLGCNHAELVFDRCRVGSDKILGEEGEGFRLVMRTVSRVRLAHIGARSVGMASRVLELARNHAAERRQFGQSIGEFQMVQKMLADMATDIFATRMMILNTAWEIDQGRDPRAQAVHGQDPCLGDDEPGGRPGGSRSSAAWASARICRSSVSIETAASFASTTARRRSTAMLIARNVLKHGFSLEGDHV